MSSVSAMPVKETLSKGVILSRIQPGGKDGPDNVVLDGDQLCGTVWTDRWNLGYSSDSWRLMIPDIRMARNQLWPMHWHDCWIAVIVLDGACMIGDWWMAPGDVLISPPGVEYGPVLNGPKGCQMFEMFARDVLGPGGYSQEYHDHPTLRYLQTTNGQPARFKDRPKGAEAHRGNQTTPLSGQPKLKTGHLVGDQRFDLGEPDDPERGVILDTVLQPGDDYPPHWYKDWRFVMVLEGSLDLAGHVIEKNAVMVIEPMSEVPPFTVGADGAHLLEVARTAGGVSRTYLEKYRTDASYHELFARTENHAFESAMR
jgi:hypothetical protein